MIKVHHLNNSRSQRVLWLLEELQVPYEIVPYMRLPIGFAPPELRDAHPLGKAPVVELEDGQRVAESGAIVALLADRYGAGTLAVGPAEPEYVRYVELLHYIEGSLSLPLMMALFGKAFGVQNEIYAGYVAGQAALHLDYVQTLLEGREFLVGQRFTAADVHMTFLLQGARRSRFLADREQLMAYIEKMEQRPAHGRAIERGGPFELGFSD